MALIWTSGKGEKGDKGDTGATGATGAPGSAGFSPNATVLPTATGATITIQDHNGITSAEITNGIDGEKGDAGVSPSATVTQTATGATVTITDHNGTTTANLTNGSNGEKGDAGVSPSATVTPNANGAEISITDANGTTTAQINNGTSGSNGVDGVSPTASVAQTATGATVTITDKNGTTTAELTNGQDGARGSDGVSPTANIQQTATGATISITDQTGTTTANITNGQNGAKGDPGQGVPAGGTAGQVLSKVDGTDYNTQWVTPQSGGGLAIGSLLHSYTNIANLIAFLQTKIGETLYISNSADLTKSEITSSSGDRNANGIKFNPAGTITCGMIRLQNSTQPFVSRSQNVNMGTDGNIILPSGFYKVVTLAGVENFIYLSPVLTTDLIKPNVSPEIAVFTADRLEIDITNSKMQLRPSMDPVMYFDTSDRLVILYPRSNYPYPTVGNPLQPGMHIYG